MLRLVGLGKLNSVTSSGVESVIFLFAAQGLNRLLRAVRLGARHRL
jgi:hypothetical protein